MTTARERYVLHRTRDGLPVSNDDLGDQPGDAIRRFLGVHEIVSDNPYVSNLVLSVFDLSRSLPPWAYSMSFVLDGFRWEYWIVVEANGAPVRAYSIGWA